MKNILVSILFLLIFQLPVLAIEDMPKPQQLSASYNISMRKYMLGPNDVLSIHIQDFPEYDHKEIRVQPDGNIIIAPFGVLKVMGITMEEFYDILYAKYLEYFKNPQITIKLEKTKPFIVYVTGAVISPGSYELNSDISSNSSKSTQAETFVERRTPLLSNILVSAGGFRYDADLEHIKITNPLDNSQIEVDLLDLLENNATGQDIFLMSYDTVYIPKLPTPFAIDGKKYKHYITATFSAKETPVRVLGYVKKPGLILLNNSQSLNLNSAISTAGGYSTDLEHPPKTVYLSRVDNNGKLVTTKINPMNTEITLMPNDTVYVPEKKRTAIVKAFEHANRVLTPMNIFADSYNNWALMFNPRRYQVIGK